MAVCSVLVVTSIVTASVGASTTQADDSTVVFAVNAGGPEYTASDGTTYQADTNFDGGRTFSTGSAGTPSDPDIAGTADDTLYRSERYGNSFGYDVPVSDGTYEVTLQFAEIYQGVSSNDVPDSAGPSDGTNANDRVFSAAIEGQQLLTDYDIFADAGALTATERTYTVDVTDGTLNIDFSTTNDNAKVSAIKISAIDETAPSSDTVFAVNAGGSEYTANDGTTYQADMNFDGGNTFSTGSAGTPSDPDIADTTNDVLYQSERYGNSFGYDVPVSDGTYEVTLQFAEIYQGVSSNDVPDSAGPSDGTNANDRVFSAAIEGQQLLTDYDIFADAGALTATERTYTVDVTDGTLNIDFSTTNDNAKISAIEVSRADGTTPSSDTVFAVNAGGPEYAASDGSVYQADTNFDGGKTFSTGSAGTPSDPDIAGTTDDTLYQSERYGNSFGYDVPVSDGTYEVTLQFAEIYQGVSSNDVPDSAGPSDGTNENDRVFSATIEGQQLLTDYDIFAEVGSLTATERTYTVDVTDGTLNIDFTATNNNAKISAIEVSRVDETDNTAPTIESISDQTVTAGESIDVPVSSSDADSGDTPSLSLGQAPPFASLSDSGDGTGTISLAPQADDSGSYTVEVIASDGTATATETFTVTVEDAPSNTAPTIESISDQTVTAGESIDVPVSSSDADSGDTPALSLGQAPSFVSLSDSGDGTGTVSIAPQTDDPGSYTVEVVASDGTATATETFTVTVEDTSTSTDGEATITINSGRGIDTSTYRSGSFEITNTGDEPIESVTLDLRSAILPDLVFDPEGTAGDKAAKGFVLDSDGTSGTVESTIAKPHNGVDGSDGYDTLTVTFGSFQPGESVAFSVDNDPTSIKGGGTAQNSEAGPVSGLELSGSTVTAEFGDGSTVETALFSDGSLGGSQGVADADVPSAPTIDAQGVPLTSTTLSDSHTAATVTDADQTITVTGEPGDTVTLLRVEGELNLEEVPEYDGTPGYEIEAYEANTAIQVEEYTATIGDDGTAAVPVTLTDSSADGGFNYFVAVTEDDDGDTGQTSNKVVLKYE